MREFVLIFVAMFIGLGIGYWSMWMKEEPKPGCTPCAVSYHYEEEKNVDMNLKQEEPKKDLDLEEAHRVAGVIAAKMVAEKNYGMIIIMKNGAVAYSTVGPAGSGQGLALDLVNRVRGVVVENIAKEASK